MPNNCENQLTFTVAKSNPNLFNRLVEAMEQERFFNEICPLSDSASIDEILNKWDTKWDAYESDCIIDRDTQTATFIFFTAWKPPSKVYEQMHKMEDITHYVATYSETGNAICGIYTDGLKGEHDVAEYTEDWIEANLPDCVIENHNLYEMIT